MSSLDVHISKVSEYMFKLHENIQAAQSFDELGYNQAEFLETARLQTEDLFS